MPHAQPTSPPAAFARAYRAIRTVLHYPALASVLEGHADARYINAACTAAMLRLERPFSVACSKTAPDFGRAIKLNLDAARYRRRAGWAAAQAARMALR